MFEFMGQEIFERIFAVIGVLWLLKFFLGVMVNIKFSQPIRIMLLMKIAEPFPVSMAQVVGVLGIFGSAVIHLYMLEVGGYIASTYKTPEEKKAGNLVRKRYRLTPKGLARAEAILKPLEEP